MYILINIYSYLYVYSRMYIFLHIFLSILRDVAASPYDASAFHLAPDKVLPTPHPRPYRRPMPRVLLRP